MGVFARVSRLLFIVATIRATGLRDSSAPWSGVAGAPDPPGVAGGHVRGERRGLDLLRPWLVAGRERRLPFLAADDRLDGARGSVGAGAQVGPLSLRVFVPSRCPCRLARRS